jgi:hypothetical protein
MPTERDHTPADNLRRWLESGQPRAWVDSRYGQWAHADWLVLLGNLRHSEFWPLDPAEALALLKKFAQERSNLRRLIQSGLLQRWVEAHRGAWDHADWLALLDALRAEGFAPLAPEAVRRLLEGLTTEWHNLRRWEQSGQPRRWLEARGGAWDRADWLSLVMTLRASEFWPLDLTAVAAVLERLKGPCANLSRWIASGWPRRWVEARGGRWEGKDWLALLEALRLSPYWPLDTGAVGRVLEEHKRQLLNLRRWERSGQARAWVEARGGRWDHADWLALLDDLRQSEFWPLEPAGVGEVLAEIQKEWRNLSRWQESGQAWKWVNARAGRWDRVDWLALWESLRASEFWPLDGEAAAKVLQRITAEWWNLRRWQASGQPRLWVQARRGRWGHEDWLALLANLRESQYWPIASAAVGEVLEQAKREYQNLQRWLESDQPRRWVEARQGRWGEDDWQALLAALERSEFWPLDPAMAQVELEEMQRAYDNLCRWRESGAARKWVEAHRGQWGHGDWLALLASLRASASWPLDPAAVGRVLAQVRVEWLDAAKQSEAARRVAEGPYSPARQAA